MTYIEENRIKLWENEGYIHLDSIINHTMEILDKNFITHLNIVDIGSNIGKYTFILSRKYKVNNALLIEPIIELLEFSKQQFVDSGINMFYENVALSDVIDTYKMYIPVDDNLGVGRLGHDKYSGDRQVSVTTLDALMTEKYLINFVPNLIKIDAEGYDTNILHGMKQYLTTLIQKPIIIFEISLNQISNKVLETIRSDFSLLGYNYVDYTPEAMSKDIYLIPTNLV